MKKIILTSILLIISSAIFGQIEIKGLRLGSKMVFKDKTMSLVNENYYFAPQRTNNKTIYQIVLIPANGDNVRRVHSSEIHKLLIAMETKYSIVFKFLEEEYKENEGWYVVTKNNVRYTIAIHDYNQSKNKPYEIAIYITNEQLEKIASSEKQEKANADI